MLTEEMEDELLEEECAECSECEHNKDCSEDTMALTEEELN